MTIDWKPVVAALAAAMVGAGGTLGAQHLTSPPPGYPQLQLVENMTGLCIRVDVNRVERNP